VIELYHFAISTCSQKVRLVLAEKSLEFVSHEVDLMAGRQHDPAYVKLNPKHVVPTLVHDGHVLVESSLIVRYLDDAFPGSPMRPKSPLGRYEVERWIRRIDEELHPAAPTVTFALGPRDLLLRQPVEVREANIAAIWRRRWQTGPGSRGNASGWPTRRCSPTCCGSSTSPWTRCSSDRRGPAWPNGSIA
jgi:glutathione S-transferase